MSLQKQDRSISESQPVNFLKGNIVSRFLSGTSFSEPDQVVNISMPTEDCQVCSHCGC
ncbi:MAG: hypothetical protein ACPKQO_05400 [Nitrososphaeraceae archaeon]